MDDLYAINAAKIEFREGFNLGDTSRILLAEGHLHRRLFGQMLRRMDLLSVPSG
jgi:hypothetical protein